MTTIDPQTAGTPRGEAAPEPEVGRTQWVALVVLLVAVFMDMLDGNVVSVAIPSIQRELGAGYAAIQWITAGYVLTFALLLITGGRLGDIYGRKKMFLIGVLGFTVMSLACGIATSPEMLIVARLLQGATAGLMVPQVLSIIHVTFPKGQQGKVFAVYGMVGGIAATVAPLVGGLIVDADLFGLDWRPVFLMNVPVGIAGLYIGWKCIKESLAERTPRLDLPGVLLAMATVVLLMFPLTHGREYGWPLWGFALMALAAVGLAVFVAYERRTERAGDSPLVPLRLFRTRTFVASLGLQLTVYLFTGAFFLCWYLFMQLGLGWSPLHAGLTALSFCLGAFVSSALSVTVLVPKFGRTVLQVGAVLLLVGLLLFLWALGSKGAGIGSWDMAPALFVIGVGFGCLAPPIPQFALSDVSHEDAGSASGLINTMQQLGLALGIALVSVLFFLPLASQAERGAADAGPDIRVALQSAGVPQGDLDAATAAFRDCAAGTSGAAGGDCIPTAVRGNEEASATLGKLRAEVTGDSFTHAFKIAVIGSMAVSVATLLMSFALPRHARQQQEA